MITLHGVKGTERDGIFFTEGAIPGAAVLRHLRTEISRQNSSLSAVKDALASDVRAAGGNALMNFKYGQRAHRPLELISFKWDTESWYGEGDAVRV